MTTAAHHEIEGQRVKFDPMVDRYIVLYTGYSGSWSCLGVFESLDEAKAQRGHYADMEGWSRYKWATVHVQLPSDQGAEA